MNYKSLKIVLLSMDLHAKKIDFLQEFLAISNEKIVDKLTNLLKKEQQQLDPVLKEKLNSRALKAEQDIAEGRTMTRKQMEQKLNTRLGL